MNDFIDVVLAQKTATGYFISGPEIDQYNNPTPKEKEYPVLLKNEGSQAQSRNQRTGLVSY